MGSEINWKRWQLELSKLLDRLEQHSQLSRQAVAKSRDKIDGYLSARTGQSRVVNAGLLNAGKSTLFNAIYGQEELFATAGVRRTSRRQVESIRNFALIDTPGLDATAEDEKEALEVYRRSQVILFTHSAGKGEFEKLEVQFLRKLRELFPDKILRKKSIIPVITKSANAGDGLDKVVKKVRRQWQTAMGVAPQKVFTVRAKTHLKGLAEDKELLCQHSQVPALLEYIQNIIDEIGDRQDDLFRQRINDEVDTLIHCVERALARQRKKRDTKRKENKKKIAAITADVEDFSTRHQQEYQSI